MSRPRNLALAAAAALVWLNLYICREAFWATPAPRWNAMHGVWLALAGTSAADWLLPRWWPYWFGGMPIEHAYAPAVPWLLAAGLRFPQLAALVWILGPLAWFALAWRLSRSAGWSLAAAAAASLWPASQLLFPELPSRWQSVTAARRFYILFTWDEVPHLLALALVSLAVAALDAGWRRRATLLMAAALAANAFAMPLAAILTALWAAARGITRERIFQAAGVLAPAYLLVSPWLAPPLIDLMRRNAAAAPERGSLAGLLAAIVAAAALLWITRRRGDPALRFSLALSVAMLVIVWRQGLPQPGRYASELDFALPLAAAMAVRAISPPRVLAALLAAAALWPAAQQTIALRRFAKADLRATHSRHTPSIEERIGAWTASHPDAMRLFAAGSIGQWLNTFSTQHQIGGGSYPTAPESMREAASWIYLAPPQQAIAWLKAMGAGSIVVPGRASPEFWKPFPQPERFASLLPEVWRDDDTVIYEIPLRSRSLAHLVPRAALDSVDRYNAALDAEAPDAAAAVWEGPNRLRIRFAPAPEEHVLSLQVTAHQGWRARVNGAATPVQRDALGRMWLDPAPQCAAPQPHCEAILEYGGGAWFWFTRAASAVTLACLVLFNRRRGVTLLERNP